MCHPYEHYLVTYSLVFVIGGPAGCGWVLREMDEYGAISRVSNCCAFEIMLIISLNSMLGVIVSIVCRQR